MSDNGSPDIIRELYSVITARKAAPEEDSYTSYLFESGLDKILKKIGEECAETIIAAKNGSREEIIFEVSDLIYHLLVMMAERGVTPDDIFAELAERSKKMHNLKQSKTVDKNT